MTKKNKPSKRKNNPIRITARELIQELPPDLKEFAIPKSITKTELIKRLEDNPRCIADFEIREAIERLQDMCIWGSKQQARRAREVLSKLLIPKAASKHKVNHARLAYWKKESSWLVQVIEHYAYEMRPGWDKGKTKMKRRKEAFKCLEQEGRYPTEEEYKKITIEGKTIRDRNFGDFVLSCFAYHP